MTLAASGDNTRTSKFKDLDSRQNDLNDSNSAIIEVFFDCVSRFSSGDSHLSIDELSVNFFGAPEYRFELLPSFYPEQYVSEGSISEEVFAVATKVFRKHFYCRRERDFSLEKRHGIRNGL